MRVERVTRDALGLEFSSSSSRVRLRFVELGSMFSESMKIVFLGLLIPFRERTGSRVPLAGAVDPTMDLTYHFAGSGDSASIGSSDACAASPNSPRAGEWESW